MRRRIENDDLINIWTQTWILIQVSLTFLLHHLWVSKICMLIQLLIMKEMVERIFNYVDVRAIKFISLMNSQANDLLIWNQSASGNFTMRLAYHLMEKMICNSTLKVEGNWYLIRALRIPPKVKYFLWHTLRSGLPTRTRFQQKEVQHTSLSKYCGTKMENE